MKICKQCKCIFPVERFAKQGVSRLTERQYYRPRCKSCDSIFMKPHRDLSNHKRRKRSELVINDLTDTQWKQILQHFENRCAYCGQKSKLVKDHFVPLALLGGYTMSNIVPACSRCNCRKSDSAPWDWLDEGKYSELSVYLGTVRKTLSDQWGTPEKVTLSKQAQAVQLQRLSERGPTQGHATVWTASNDKMQRLAEMTSPEATASW